MNNYIRGWVFLLFFLSPCFANEGIVVGAKSISELQNRLFEELGRKPFLGFIATRDRSVVPGAIRDSIGGRLGGRSIDYDFVLIRSDAQIVKSEIYYYKGTQCDWKCDSLWVHLDSREGGQVSIIVIPVNPMVALGRVFNIHTFSFTPNWVKVSENPYDVKIVLRHFARILGERAVDIEGSSARVNMDGKR